MRNIQLNIIVFILFLFNREWEWENDDKSATTFIYLEQILNWIFNEVFYAKMFLGTIATSMIIYGSDCRVTLPRRHWEPPCALPRLL